MNKQIKDEFINSLKFEDPRCLLETWHNRSNDEFYTILEELKFLTDNYFLNQSKLQTNPLLFVMLTYCFDGNKIKTVEKTREILSKLIDNEKYNVDEICSKFVDLEVVSEDNDTIEIFNINSKLDLSKYYELYISGFDDDYVLSGKSIKFLKGENDNSFVIKFDAIGDNEDLSWLEETLFIRNNKSEYKKQNISFGLHNKSTNTFYDLFYLTDCEPIDYLDKELKNEIITLEFLCNEYYIVAESDNDLIEDIKNNIDNSLKNFNVTKNENIPLYEKSISLDFSNTDQNFIIEGFDYDIIADRLKLSYNTNSEFIFEFKTSILKKEEINLLSESVFYHLVSLTESRVLPSKQSIVKDLHLQLFDKVDEKLFNIANLNNAYVIDYKVNEDNSIVFKIVCDTFFIADPDKDQVANYVRSEISHISSLYRDELNKIYNQQIESDIEL